jgi:hypothetical protein
VTFPGKRCVQDFPTPENHFHDLLEEPPVVQGATAVNCTTDERAFEGELSGLIDLCSSVLDEMAFEEPGGRLPKSPSPRTLLRAQA